MKDVKAYVAIALAAAALVVSIRSSSRDREPSAAAGSACVDRDARARTEQLSRELASRDMQIARLTNEVRATPSAASTPTPAAPQGPRRYTHFEISNPGVSMSQKADGTYDIRSTDPKLAGSVIAVSAVTASGEADQMYVRIPDATN